MGILSDIKKNRESQWILNEKRRLLELWGSGTITEQQYKVGLAQLDLGVEQARLDKKKITPGKVAVWLATGKVKWLVNGVFAISGSSMRPFKKK